MPKEENDQRPRWIGLSVVYVILGVLSVAPVIMLPMAFDAPGPEKNGDLLALAASMAFFPISCLLGVILPWIFRRWRYASKLFLMPVLNVGVTVIMVVVGIAFGLLQRSLAP